MLLLIYLSLCFNACILLKCLYFQKVAEARRDAIFGQGSGPIFLDDVRCRGTELRLTSCTHNGVGVHNCGHSEDAGVICKGKLVFVQSTDIASISNAILSVLLHLRTFHGTLAPADRVYSVAVAKYTIVLVGKW